MNGGFTKGLIIGSMIGASVGMAIKANMMKDRSRRKMMNAGRDFLRKTGTIIGDVIDVFR